MNGKYLGSGGAGDTEKTFLFLRGAYLTPENTALKPKKLFTTDRDVADQYQSISFDEAARRNMVNIVTHLEVSHNYVFAPQDGESIEETINYFEKTTLVEFKILNRVYDELPLATLLNYSRARKEILSQELNPAAGTPNDLTYGKAGYDIIRKSWSSFQFPEEILLPEANIEVTIKPDIKLVTAAAATTNPPVNDMAYANDRGFMLNINFIGRQERK